MKVMPEGDTVYKVAMVLAQELEGEVLTRCHLRGIHGAERLAGAMVLELETAGKHLLIHLDREIFLRVHLGMHGSWHRYPAGARWKRSPAAAGVVLETARSALVCFNPMEVEAVPTVRRRWHRQLSKLGPDLLADEEPDWQAILERCRQLRSPGDPLGEVLLDQRLAAGIGNVYKSELAFMGPLQDDAFSPADHSYSPWLAWTKVPPEALLGMFRRGRELLFANLGGWLRTTRADRRKETQPKEGNLYVYGRVGKPCSRCESEIARGHQGLQNRVTYWCPTCQPDTPAN